MNGDANPAPVSGAGPGDPARPTAAGARDAPGPTAHPDVDPAEPVAPTPGPAGAATVPVVLIAHGSRAAAANEAHDEVCRELARRTGRPVHAAFLELAEPSIPDAIVAAASGGVERIEVLPHFLYPGRHLREDIPALIAEAESRLGGVEVVLLPASGDDEAMVDLLAAQVEAGGGRRTMF